MSDFGNLVSHVMGSLLATHGFRMISQGPGTVIYKSDICTLSIVRDFLGSTEIYFGLRSHTIDHGCDYAVDHILNALSVPAALQPPGYETKDEAGVCKLLSLIASLLDQYGEALFRGDEATWARLRAYRAAESAKYALETEKRLALGAAEAAWHERNWRKYFELLDGLRAHLSPADLAKLAYAERRMTPH